MGAPFRRCRETNSAVIYHCLQTQSLYRTVTFGSTSAPGKSSLLQGGGVCVRVGRRGGEAKAGPPQLEHHCWGGRRSKAKLVFFIQTSSWVLIIEGIRFSGMLQILMPKFPLKEQFHQSKKQKQKHFYVIYCVKCCHVKIPVCKGCKNA